MRPDLKTISGEQLPSLSSRHNHPPRRGSWKISKNLQSSLRYAIQGLIYGFSSQRNFRIHLFLGAITFALGFWLSLSPIHMSILVLTVSSVLVLELINTSIEAIVDLSIGPRFDPLAAIAKDCAAAAVFIGSIGSLLIAFFLLLPAFLIRLGI